jgi:hypothetical protein
MKSLQEIHRSSFSLQNWNPQHKNMLPC